MTKKALILGAGGFAGSHCLNHLLKHPDYAQVTALVKDPLDLSHPKLKVYQVNFDNPTEWESLTAADDVFICHGATMKSAGSKAAFRKVDVTLTLQAARQAQTRGAMRLFLITASSTSPYSPLWYCRTKAEVERRIQAMDFQHIAIFRPSIFLGHRNEPRWAESVGKTIMSFFAPLMIGPIRKFRPIHVSCVGRAMVVAASRNIRGVRIYESDEMQVLAEGPLHSENVERTSLSTV